MTNEEIEAKCEKQIEVVIKMPEWVLKHKRASYVLWMVDDTSGLEVDQEFHYFRQDLKLAETIKREAVEQFAEYYDNDVFPEKGYAKSTVEKFLKEKPQ